MNTSMPIYAGSAAHAMDWRFNSGSSLKAVLSLSEKIMAMNMGLARGFLIIAIISEIMGTSLLKLSDGFAKWQWGTLAIFCYSICFWFLAPAMKAIPVGIVYAIWSGVGIVAISIIGLLVFKERLEWFQYGFIALILIGAIGLNIITKAPA